jgi:Flp pilus assembly protein TadD
MTMIGKQRALFELGKRYWKGEQYAEALATLRMAFVAYGAEPELDRLLGSAAQKCDDDETAQAAYERALPHFPKDVYLRVNLAEIYLKQVRLLDASRLLKEAMALEPEIKTPGGFRARVLIMKAQRVL